jgi:hypothetical protein
MKNLQMCFFINRFDLNEMDDEQLSGHSSDSYSIQFGESGNKSNSSNKINEEGNSI